MLRDLRSRVHSLDACAPGFLTCTGQSGVSEPQAQRLPPGQAGEARGYVGGPWGHSRKWHAGRKLLLGCQGGSVNEASDPLFQVSLRSEGRETELCVLRGVCLRFSLPLLSR